MVTYCFVRAEVEGVFAYQHSSADILKPCHALLLLLLSHVEFAIGDHECGRRLGDNMQDDMLLFCVACQWLCKACRSADVAGMHAELLHLSAYLPDASTHSIA